MNTTALTDKGTTVLATAYQLLLSREELQQPTPWLPFGKRARWYTVSAAILFVGGMFGGIAGQTLGGFETSVALVLPLAYAQTLPILLAWRMPLIAWRLLAIVALVTSIVNPLAHWTWPWAVCACIVYAVSVLLVAIRYPRRVSAGVFLVTVFVIVGVGMFTAHVQPLSLMLIAVGTIAVMVVGDSIRIRIDAQRDLDEQRQLRQRDQIRQELLEARQAILTERSRIARELHDVVAHHMSMIAIQAQAAPYKIPDLPPPALATFQAIRSASTTALTEMRRVIGLLRDESEDAERVPQPGLANIGDLVAGARQAGMSVDLSVHGTPNGLPLGVDVSAYRIIQESLSNATRHAAGARAYVEVNHESDHVLVRVTNDAPPVGPSHEAGEVLKQTSGGHGVVGMRERVAMLGGELEVGPTDTGGFRVRAVLPVQADLVRADEDRRDDPGDPGR
ncbi:sensor histidine kinase [Fodinicola acaciae]|uniref:sensor histidine kinase n=1 Tax=Fodinicola acaciae TaxID=2681555 RepID=UPI0013D81E85|nr:sensor histidine kinase [Fodinicola acaciae]